MDRLLIVHDTKIKTPDTTGDSLDSVIRTGLSSLGLLVEVDGFRTFVEAQDALRDREYDVVVADQSIPESEETMWNPNSDYGDRLARSAAQTSTDDQRKCLVIQYTENPEGSISAGTSHCPIFKFLGNDTELTAVLADWLKDRALDASSAKMLSRGRIPWRSPNQQTAEEAFLCQVHNSRHDAISPYLAINNEIQNIDYWRSDEFVDKFRETEPQDRISKALARMVENANTVLSDKTLPQIGGLLTIEMPPSDRRELKVEDYLRSGSPETSEPVIVDDGYSLLSNGKSVHQALDDALEAEQNLRRVCAELADPRNAEEDSVGHDELRVRFEQHFEEMKQSLEVIVQFFEKQFRDPQRKE